MERYTFDHDVTATAPRVFVFDEHACVAGYGDGSLRLQQMQPIFGLIEVDSKRR